MSVVTLKNQNSDAGNDSIITDECQRVTWENYSNLKLTKLKILETFVYCLFISILSFDFLLDFSLIKNLYSSLSLIICQVLFSRRNTSNKSVELENMKRFLPSPFPILALLLYISTLHQYPFHLHFHLFVLQGRMWFYSFRKSEYMFRRRNR